MPNPEITRIDITTVSQYQIKDTSQNKLIEKKRMIEKIWKIMETFLKLSNQPCKLHKNKRKKNMNLKQINRSIVMQSKYIPKMLILTKYFSSWIVMSDNYLHYFDIPISNDRQAEYYKSKKIITIINEPQA